MKLADIIDTFITGDWGEESPTQDTPNAAYCVRGADIVPITNHNFTDIPQRYVCDRTKEAKLLAAGDLVIEKSGGSPTQSTGRIVYVSEDLIKAKGNVVCSNFCTAFRVKAGWNPLYVYYFWQNVYNHGAFFNFEGKTSGIKNLQLDNALSAIDIEYLPLEKQNQIVASLASIDEKIKVNRQINDNLEAMAKQLYDYWFVQFDFPNEEGKPYKSSGGAMVWNEKLKREIPKGWNVANVFDELSVQYGFPFSTELFTEEPTSIPVVRIRDILENSVSAYSEEEVDEKYRLQEQDLLVGMDGNFHMNYWNDNVSYLNQRSVRLRAKSKSTVSIMQAKYDIAPYIKAKELRAKGSTVGHLSEKDLKELFVLVCPNIDFRNKFDSILAEIIENRCEMIELTKQRDELLPLLMNGQATVNYHLSASTYISFDISVLFLNFTNGNSLYETISLDYQRFALPLHSKENTHGTIQEDKRHIQQRQRQGD